MSMRMDQEKFDTISELAIHTGNSKACLVIVVEAARARECEKLLLEALERAITKIPSGFAGVIEQARTAVRAAKGE